MTAPRILAVDDDPLTLKFLARVLAGAGYEVTRAASGAEALRACAGRAFDVALVDVVMPGMSGRELSERLATSHAGMKVLYMSGYTDDAVVLHGVLAEEMAFLQKPFTINALARKVRALLDER